MTKAELIASVAKEAKISKVSAERAVNALTKALKKGDKLTLPGFGTFSVAKRRPACFGLKKGRKTTSFLHVTKPATSHKILKSLKINKVSGYAIYNKLSH